MTYNKRNGSYINVFPKNKCEIAKQMTYVKNHKKPQLLKIEFL